MSETTPGETPVEGAAMRWRVRLSKRTPHWVYYAVTEFVDAETPARAAASAEQLHASSDTRAEAYDVTPATPEMEEAHRAHRQRVASWIDAAKRGQAGRWVGL